MEYTEEQSPPEVITSDTDNATKIIPEDAPIDERSKFKRFRAYNTGTWNGPKRENKDIIYQQDNLHRYDAIASTLELTKLQKHRGRDIIDKIDLGEFNKGSENVDHVIFGLCVLLVNDDVQDGTRYWPHADSKENDDLFKEFAKTIDLTIDEQMSIVQRVRSRTKL